jgi:hypothetical protein
MAGNLVRLAAMVASYLAQRHPRSALPDPLPDGPSRVVGKGRVGR